MMLITKEHLLADIAERLPDVMSLQALQEGFDIPLNDVSAWHQGNSTHDEEEEAVIKPRVCRLQLAAPTEGNGLSVSAKQTQPAKSPRHKLAGPSCSNLSVTSDGGDTLCSSKSELHYREMFEKMHMAAALHEAVIENGKVIDSIFKDVNPAFLKNFGLERNEIIGQRLTSVFPGIENDQAQWIYNFGQVALHGGTHEFQSYSQKFDRWYSGVAYRPDPVAHEFCCIFADISRDVQTQEEISESEERHRNLFECRWS